MNHTSPTTASNLNILDPELAALIRRFPTTTEHAKDAETVVHFMRAFPIRDHHLPGVIKGDIQVSAEESSEDQPPTTVRVFIPIVEDNAQLFPAVIWMHHGGLFAFGPMQLDPFCSAICVEAQVVILVPSTRQIPEYSFPIPFNDAYQVLTWLITCPNVTKYSIDRTRVAVGGTSIGGTLAIGMLLKLRDEMPMHVPKIRLLLMDDASVDDDSTSYSTRTLPITRIWNANVTRFMWRMYLPNGSAAINHPSRGYAVPALAQSLEGLPPTMILCAEWDDLTNDAILFAHRLLESGIRTEIHIIETYRGTFHISDKLLHDIAPSVRKRADIINALAAAFEER